ncbi:hypothetical protein [Geodermatophilus sp. FMUSA9-8]|uniref:hypothetical protein n=1 Tax=Geodermatophilus sp. FMUSA9-8 TaxID=3120155 RepID=UPI0030080DB5
MTTVRGAVWLGVVALAGVAVYAALVVLPYFVNGLDRFPLADVAIGHHDPKDLWPATVPYVGGWLHLFGVLSMAFAPATLVCVAFASGFASVWAGTRRAWSVTAAHTAVVLGCVAAAAWFVTPFAEALAGWQLD